MVEFQDQFLPPIPEVTYSTLRPEDLRRVVTMMPRDVFTMLKNSEQPLYLAGGSIRSIITSQPVSDWDIFGPTAIHLELEARRLFEKRKGRFFTTANAFTVLSPPRTPVQFIKRWLFSDLKSLMASFDYSIARAAVHWDGEAWVSICDEVFYPDLAARRLRYMQPERNEDAGGSMLRIQKFLHAGFHISPESMAKVLARLTIKMRDNSKFSDTEAGHATVIQALLRQVDPLTIIDGLEMPEDEIEQNQPAKSEESI